MGKKLDALLGRKFKTTKLKATVNLAISRLSVLKNQRQTRCSLARSDVLQLLNLGHHERALLRVEQVIKEQNMVDVFVMVEGYCLVLIERVNLIEHEKVCPDELKEAISSLIYASTRCGEFPELPKIRAIFTSRFGKEFATRAIELRNNCGVNPKMIQKLSTRTPSLENRLKVLNEIASENNIVLQIEEVSPVTTELLEKSDTEQKQDQPKLDPSTHSISAKLDDNLPISPEELVRVDGFSNSMEARKKFRDVADAAQAAFESAAYAAAAARAAVELSRSRSHDPDDSHSPNTLQRKGASIYQPMKSKLQIGEEVGDISVGLGFEKKYPIPNFLSESEDEEMYNKNKSEKANHGKRELQFKRSISSSGSDSADNILKGSKLPSDLEGQSKAFGRTTGFDESDDETENEQPRILLSRTHDLGFGIKHASATEVLSSEESSTIKHEKNFPLRSQAGLEEEPVPGDPKQHVAQGSRIHSAEPLNAENRPVSVRTRRTQRQ
ncbi:unnamed protein product [Ilex paraguariensis]|uniref:IST1-like protein n=1 Tax=Ilex paraguariensis TaxID=185542 RepID=A0ABC8U4J3_9AQUA